MAEDYSVNSGATFHTFTVWSLLADATCLPSGLNVTLQTVLLWACSVNVSCHVSAFQIFISAFQIFSDSDLVFRIYVQRFISVFFLFF